MERFKHSGSVDIERSRQLIDFATSSDCRAEPSNPSLRASKSPAGITAVMRDHLKQLETRVVALIGNQPRIRGSLGFAQGMHEKVRQIPNADHTATIDKSC
jgi:hypothetical protein